MADAKPTNIHNVPDREVPPAGEAPKAREAIKILDVSGKVVKLVAEYKVGDPDAKGNQTVRRDYE